MRRMHERHTGRREPERTAQAVVRWLAYAAMGLLALGWLLLLGYLAWTAAVDAFGGGA